MKLDEFFKELSKCEEEDYTIESIFNPHEKGYDTYISVSFNNLYREFSNEKKVKKVIKWLNENSTKKAYENEEFFFKNERFIIGVFINKCGTYQNICSTRAI